MNFFIKFFYLRVLFLLFTINPAFGVVDKDGFNSDINNIKNTSCNYRFNKAYVNMVSYNAGNKSKKNVYQDKTRREMQRKFYPYNECESENK